MTENEKKLEKWVNENFTVEESDQWYIGDGHGYNHYITHQKSGIMLSYCEAYKSSNYREASLANLFVTGVKRGGIGLGYRLYESSKASKWKKRFEKMQDLLVDQRDQRVLQDILNMIETGAWYPDKPDLQNIVK